MGKRTTKVVLDTNIIISAFGWLTGNPHRILENVSSGEIKLFISYEQFEEISRVLEYPKLRFTEEQKLGLKRFLSEEAIFVQPAKTLDIVKDDPSDNRILECALVAKADYVISGDEHLLAIGRLKGTKIVTAGQFLNET